MTQNNKLTTKKNSNHIIYSSTDSESDNNSWSDSDDTVVVKHRSESNSDTNSSDTNSSDNNSSDSNNSNKSSSRKNSGRKPKYDYSSKSDDALARRKEYYVQSKKDKQTTCEHCQKTFSKYYITKHKEKCLLKSHDEIKKQKAASSEKVKCNACGKMYNSTYLRYHKCSASEKNKKD